MYTLKEENEIFGQKGYMISEDQYNLLIDEHKKFFKKFKLKSPRERDLEDMDAARGVFQRPMFNNFSQIVSSRG